MVCRMSVIGQFSFQYIQLHKKIEEYIWHIYCYTKQIMSVLL